MIFSGVFRSRLAISRCGAISGGRPLVTRDRDADDAEKRVEREVHVGLGPGRARDDPLLAVDRREDADRAVATRKLPRQRALAVPVGDDAVGHPARHVDDRDAEQVADLRIADLDRSGDDVRPVGRVATAGRDELDGVVEHLLAGHAVRGEEGGGVASLVVEQALVRERVDRDLDPRVDGQHGCIGGAGQTPPEDGCRVGGQVRRGPDHPGGGLQNVGHRAPSASNTLKTMASYLRSHSSGLHLGLMLALTFSTGVVDAVGYLGLDRVFTGNMTGNVVILAMALTGADGLPILGPVIALVAFLLGAAISGRTLRNLPAGWTLRTTVLFGAVALLLTASAITAFSTQDRAASVALVVTGALGLAMGMQAGAARHIGVKDVTTVVVTSTLVGLAFDSRFAGNGKQQWGRRAGAIVLIGAGAAAGALLLHVHIGLGMGLAALITIVVTILGFIGRPHPAQAG